jgi:hypothetical protein
MKINTILVKVGVACLSVAAGLVTTELIGKGIGKIMNKPTI